MSDSVLLGSCGAVGVGTTMIPTLLLIASEILGMSKGKSNGIIHFVYCIGVVCVSATVGFYATDHQLEVSCSAKIAQGLGAIPGVMLSVAIMRTFFEHWDRIYIHDTLRLKERRRNRNIILVLILVFVVIFAGVELSAAEAENKLGEKWTCMYRVYNFFKVICIVMYFYFFVELTVELFLRWVKLKINRK